VSVASAWRQRMPDDPEICRMVETLLAELSVSRANQMAAHVLKLSERSGKRPKRYAIRNKVQFEVALSRHFPLPKTH
jgi:hypothetical protein